VPFAPDVIVIHDVGDDAVHVHPASVLTLKLPVVASAGTEAVTGVIE
jgi:hypothetical protein